MFNLIILCGIPGSGKSTISKKISKKYNAIRLSFDEMNCFKYCQIIKPALEKLKKGNNVIIDALFDRKKYRNELLISIKDIKCKKTLIFMNTPLEECIRRNEQREGDSKLPIFIIEDIYNSFEPPTLDEGWDEIIYY